MLIIRDAQIGDIEQIAEIYNWAVENTTATFDLEKQSLDNRKEWFRHYGGAHPLIVAELDGRVVGYCSLSKFREKQAYARTVEVSVYIHPEYHGKGLGKKLLGEIIERGRSLGHHVIIACITAGNDISVKMHEKFGFYFCGRLNAVGYKFDRWQDILFYQLEP